MGCRSLSIQYLHKSLTSTLTTQCNTKNLMHARSEVRNEVRWLQRFSNFYSCTAELSSFNCCETTSHLTAVQCSDSFTAHSSVFDEHQLCARLLNNGMLLSCWEMLAHMHRGRLSTFSEVEGALFTPHINFIAAYVARRNVWRRIVL